MADFARVFRFMGKGQREASTLRPHSGAFEAIRAFVAAKVHSGSNVTCNVLLADCSPALRIDFLE